MNWIKQNTFLSALLGITFVLCALLTFVALKGGTKYQNAKNDYDSAFQAVSKMERLPLYPTASNRDAKKKALDDYRESIEEFRGFYEKYRVTELENISTQKFTENLIAANQEVEAAFTGAGSKLPDDFLMGFEVYRNQLAKSGSTALLNYQLQAVRHLLLGLAESRPTGLIRFYREKIPEENDTAYPLREDEVARKFSYEISIKGSEASVRDFLSKLGDTKSHYYVIRSIRINNERDVPPRISDAKFERPVIAPAGVLDFGALFTEENEAEPEKTVVEPKPENGADEGAVDGAEKPEEAVADEVVVEPAPFEIPAPSAVDSSKILAQVLGGEELVVFVRFDILLFLPTKELIKP
jgi:hypothetical protein